MRIKAAFLLAVIVAVFLAPSADAATPTSGPSYPWHVGNCADILLHRTTCADGVWRVSYHGTAHSAAWNQEKCAVWGSVALTVGSGRLTCWDLTDAARGE